MSAALLIPSDRPAFDGFADYYEDEIVPHLQAREQKRRRAVMRFGMVLAVTAILSVILILVGPFGGDGNFKAAFLVGGLGASGAIALLNHARADIAGGLLHRICTRFGFHYRQKPGRPESYAAFRALDLLPGHNRESWEDEVRGRHAGAGFFLCEAHLKQRSSGKNKSTRTVFHGQLFVIDYHKDFLGETVVKRDFGMFNRFARPGREFSRVGLVSSKFEEAFEAWSTDQVEAREILDPLVLERFLELERLFGGKKLRAAFSEGKLLIVLETGDALNMGSMFKALEDGERVEAILKQFDLIFDLIDVAVKQVDRPIDGAFSVEDVRPNTGGA